MRDLNRATLIGRTTDDLEVQKIGDNDTSVVNFNLATNRDYTNSDGNKVEESEFHRCVAFGKVADILGQYLDKGKRVYIEGRLRTRQWEDSNGNNRYTTEVVVNNFIFLDSKNSGGSQQVPSENSSTSSSSSSQQQDEEDLPF